MATSSSNDSRCATCGKVAGTFTCCGCGKDFCLRHTNEHRQELSKQMDENVIPLHDQLQQSLDEQTKKPSHHPLMKQINEWKQLSVEKIHQAADSARKQLIQLINTHASKMKETLERLTEQLKKARDDDQFFERDLKEWMKELDALKRDLVTPQTINIRYDNNITSFISKILIDKIRDVSDECFEQALGNIQIMNNGTVIIHNQIGSYASVRSQRDYSSGEYRLRFLIENLSGNKWVFFGVVSKSAPTSPTSSVGKTAYGFFGENNVWHDGVNTNKLNGYTNDFETNDIIELFISCDQRKIPLKNERRRGVNTLDVDIAKCSFPWKLSVGLVYSPGECIRILS